MLKNLVIYLLLVLIGTTGNIFPFTIYFYPVITHLVQRYIQNLVKYLRWSVFWKKLTAFYGNCFLETLYLRYLTRFWIRLCSLLLI